MDEVFPGIFLIEQVEKGAGWRALTWFADTPEGGLLIDPQTFGPATAPALDRLGGASHVFVTHGLAAGDACKFKERYRAKLIAHKAAAAAVKACQVDLAFDRDFSLFQGVRVVCSGAHSAGSAMVYLLRDRGFLFPGDFLAVAGGRGAPTLQVREGGDPGARQLVLQRLASLRFGAVLPFYTRHVSANHLAGASNAIVDALLRDGVFVPRDR